VTGVQTCALPIWVTIETRGSLGNRGRFKVSNKAS
jgi:hypothetical protein